MTSNSSLRTCLRRRRLPLSCPNPRSAFFLPVARAAASTAVGDLNGDHILDLVVAHGWGPVGILLGDGMGNFTLGSAIPITGSGAVGDFDGDLDLDLAVSGGGGVTIFGNDGHGVFTLSESYGFGGVGVRVADFNGDSWPDLVVLDGRNDEGRSDNAADILLNDGTGRFTRSSTLIVGAYSDDLRIQDFDLDGNLDIVAVTRASQIRLFAEDGQGGFELAGTFATGVDRSFSLDAADFNGDETMTWRWWRIRNLVASRCF